MCARGALAAWHLSGLAALMLEEDGTRCPPVAAGQTAAHGGTGELLR